MNSQVYLLLTILSVVTFSGHALNTCDQTIINTISNTNNCLTNVLQKLHDMGPASPASLTQPDVQNSIRCVSVTVDSPENNVSNSTFILYFKNEPIIPIPIPYQLEDVSCGHVKEKRKLKSGEISEFQIYFLSIDKVACYYRCTNNQTEGSASGGCTVPVAKRADPAVISAIQTCKKSLAEVGITSPLVDVEVCSA